MKETKGRNGGTLKSMEKGETLNPNGRPKKLPELEKLLADVLGSKDENGDRSEAKEVLNALLKQAKKGNVRAAEVILNRAYGMPKQPVEHSGKDGNAIEFATTSLSIEEKRALLKLAKQRGNANGDAKHNTGGTSRG